VELRRYIAILRRRLLLITLTVLAGIAAGYLSTPRDSIYSAQAQIYVGARVYSAQGGGGNTLSFDQQSAIQQVIRTYAKMIDSAPVAADALQRVPDLPRSPDSLVAATVAEPEVGTSLLNITVSDVDPRAAQDLANAMTDAFVEKIQTLDPLAPPTPGTPPQLPAYVFARARAPRVPESNGLSRRLVIGGMFGLLFAGGVALMLDYLDITVKSITDAERRLELPVLGVIPLERQPSPSTAYASSPILAG
jgi:succinoglycan biosynthesis transport protein ExoP